MITFVNCSVFDGLGDASYRANVTVEGNRIETVSDAPPPPGSQVIDCGGRTVLPGLIDAHVHVYAYDLNLTTTRKLPMTMLAHSAASMMRDCLNRGFTTLRDTAGADWGLAMAIQRGVLVDVPRLFYCGRALSQTGGHVDMRHHNDFERVDDEVVICGCSFPSNFSWVVDGVDAVRKAVREELRRGASFIKFTASGGVATTADPLEALQFSDEEIRAIVEEVNNHGSYCTAHIHPDRAIRRAIELGVHCIEHGTLIERDTADVAAEAGTNIVPTLAVIRMLAEQGAKLGFPPESVEKVLRISDLAAVHLTYMRDAGVRVGFGTDLIGFDLQKYQCIEWGLRAGVYGNAEILRQATSVNAEILGAGDQLGRIAPGALADLLVAERDPVQDLSVLADDGTHLPVIMKDGKFHRNHLDSAGASVGSRR